MHALTNLFDSNVSWRSTRRAKCSTAAVADIPIKHFHFGIVNQCGADVGICNACQIRQARDDESQIRQEDDDESSPAQRPRNASEISTARPWSGKIYQPRCSSPRPSLVIMLPCLHTLTAGKHPSNGLSHHAASPSTLVLVHSPRLLYPYRGRCYIRVHPQVQPNQSA
jgi:hypothetical protein